MIRLGLCCQFHLQPIKFRTTTATHALTLDASQRYQKIAGLCLANAESLLKAITYCAANGIGSFRVNSQFWPVKTHPHAGYSFEDLPDSSKITRILAQCRRLSLKHDIRLTFHPDQFILLNSPGEDIVERSVLELEYQAEVAAMIGADVINIHAGGGYGDKPAALKRMARVLKRLKEPVRRRLTLENDDRIYTPADLLPFCREEGVPLVYDVHHHRCLPDGMSVRQVTAAALKTWDREPLFHISSPRDGWNSPWPGPHHDYIDINDFPDEWRGLDITVEVEAKHKELAVRKFNEDLKCKGVR
jgi:UV DNA damage endonuclease